MRIRIVFAMCTWIYAHAAIAEEVPVHSVSGTVTVVSEYMYRGMTQTWGQPTLQCGIAYAHESGFYAEIWGSGVSRKEFAGANVEIDLSAGYGGKISDDWEYTFGVLQVVYPGGNYKKITSASYPSQRYNMAEINAGIRFNWVTFRVSRALTDVLGFNENTGYTGGSKGSMYYELSADIPLPEEFSLGLHYGHQNMKPNLVAPTIGGSTNPDYSDYEISLNRNLADTWQATVAYSRNSNSKLLNGTPSNYNINRTRDIGKGRFSLAVTKSF